MKLIQVKEFINDCVLHNVKIPEKLVFVIEDFDKVVPEEMKNFIEVEYNMRGNGQRICITKAPK